MNLNVKYGNIDVQDIIKQLHLNNVFNNNCKKEIVIVICSCYMKTDKKIKFLALIVSEMDAFTHTDGRMDIRAGLNRLIPPS